MSRRIRKLDSTWEQLESRVLFASGNTTVLFQDGLSGYVATQDTYVSKATPTGAFGNDVKVLVDSDTGTTSLPAQGLVRFDGLFGSASNQVPAGAAILSATLTVSTGTATGDSSANSTAFHRMLGAWSESSTWDSLTSGVSADGVEAASAPDGTVIPSVLGGSVSVDVTASVGAWAAAPNSNFGWALLPAGADKWQFESSESTNVTKRPVLSVTYQTAVVNQAPAVNAGPDQTVVLPSSVSLDGTASDDGLPNPPAAVTTAWSQVSGPGTVTFGDPAAVDTTASFSIAGTYVLRLTANDGELQNSDDITVLVNADATANQSPSVNAGPDQSVTLPSAAALDGTVADDGLPNPPGALATTWSMVSGPGTVAFGNPAAVDTTATFSVAGTYVLRLTADDGAGSTSDDLTITVNPAPPAEMTIESMPTKQLSAGTGEKPQSKLWKYNGTWWGVFPTSTGTWVWRLDGSQWTSVLKLSTNTKLHADTLPVGDTTHVMLYNGTSSQLASVQYVPGSPGTYKLWSPRTAPANISLTSGVETATIAMDAADRMWLASEGSTTVEARYSDYPYSTWSKPVILATGINTDDISSIVRMRDGSVGVFWSNQTTKRFGFRTHAAGALPTAWSADEVPASQSAHDNIGLGMADDHMNLHVASDGTLYAAVKTGYDKAGYPAVSLLVRRPAGTWDNLYGVDALGTRPIGILNEAQGTFTVVYSEEPGDSIFYKTTPLSNISFAGAPQLLIKGAVNKNINNVSSTKDAVDTDAVVIAADLNNVMYGAHLRWPAPAPTAVPTGVTTSQNSLLSATGITGQVLFSDTAVL